jgi:hypothetical protein
MLSFSRAFVWLYLFFKNIISKSSNLALKCVKLSDFKNRKQKSAIS